MSQGCMFQILEVTKVLKNYDKKYGGGRVGDNNSLPFLYCWLDKNATLKNCILGNVEYTTTTKLKQSTLWWRQSLL